MIQGSLIALRNVNNFVRVEKQVLFGGQSLPEGANLETEGKRS